jgi:aquaporin Z
MKRFFAEALGAFAVVFFGTGAVVVDQQTQGLLGNLGISMVFGLIVMIMIYCLGRVSGAHMNPAVSIVMVMVKKLPAIDLIPYILSQTIGALFASLALHFLFPDNTLLGATLPSGSPAQSFILEIILTFFLVLVIFQTSTDNQPTAIFAGLLIGFTVLIEALFAGPICGASMNPVRSLAPAIISGHLEHLWIYLLGPSLGALLAIPVHKLFTQ